MTRTYNNSQKIRYNSNVVAEEKVFTVPTVIFLGVIALIFLLIVSFQSLRINNANLRIADLQDKLSDAQMMNDSLEGKLLSKRNLKKVESIATNKYGMVKPNSGSYVAVKINNDNNNKTTGSKTSDSSATKVASSVSAYNSEDVGVASNSNGGFLSRLFGGATDN